MKFNDQFEGRPTGRLRITVMRDGEIIEEMDEQNLIVDVSKTIHSRLLGGSTTGKMVTTIGFGTSGTTPVAGNTTLTSSFTKALDSVTYPASNQVQFNFSLLSTEANGKDILEFGLLTGDSSLYARRVRTGVLSKQSDISLTGSWVITF
jgi:hypothetical protein